MTYSGAGLFWAALALAIVATAAPVAQAQAQKFYHYDCAGGAHFELMTDGKAAFVQLDGKALRIPRFVSITGTRYRRGDVTIWIGKGERATLRRAGKRIECRLR